MRAKIKHETLDPRSQLNLLYDLVEAFADRPIGARSGQLFILAKEADTLLDLRATGLITISQCNVVEFSEVTRKMWLDEHGEHLEEFANVRVLTY